MYLPAKVRFNTAENEPPKVFVDVGYCTPHPPWFRCAQQVFLRYQSLTVHTLPSILASVVCVCVGGDLERKRSTRVWGLINFGSN